MSRFLFIIFLLGLVSWPRLVSAQYGFDVKTHLADKHELKVVKEGVLYAIEEAPWATMKEIGEDYSLWLKGIQRQHAGDSLRIYVDVELRSPAMFTSGELIGRYRSSISYHWGEAKEYAQESIDTDLFLSSSATDYESISEDMGRMIKLVSSFTGEPIIGNVSATLLAQLIESLPSTMQGNPSPVELMESMLLGHQVLADLESVIPSIRSY